MRKLLAKFLWSMAVFNIQLAEKLHKSGRAQFTRIGEAKGTTITLAKPAGKYFSAGDKVLILK